MHFVFLKGKKDFVRNKVCTENIPARLLKNIHAALGYKQETHRCSSASAFAYLQTPKRPSQ